MLCWSSCVDSICFFVLKVYSCACVPMISFLCTDGTRLCMMYTCRVYSVKMTHVASSNIPTSDVPLRIRYEILMLSCVARYSDVAPHVCSFVYTSDWNSVNVFWVRIHSRFWSEYKIAPIVCQINYSKVWKYNVINSYFGFENCADLVKLLIQSIIFCPGWWEHCPELQIPELGWSSIWVDQVWPVGQISTELTISANSKWRKHAFFANICAIKHMGEEEKQVKL